MRSVPVPIPTSTPTPAPVVAVCLCLLCAGCGAGYVTPTPSATPSPTTAGDGGTSPVRTPDPTPTDLTPTETPSRSATPSPTATATATPASQGAVRVVNASGGTATLPVNATLVYQRTARLLGSDARRPDAVVVRAVDAPASRSPPAFFRLWGLTRPPTDRELQVAAYVSDPDRVVVNGAVDAGPATLEATLAHESVHVVQFRREVFAAVRSPGSGPDASATTTAVTEGAAVFVADAYWRRYLADEPRAGGRPAASIRGVYANATGIGRWTAAPYRFGYRYVRERAGSPSSVASVYDDPPATTEQVLHPGVEEGPVALDARAVDTETWEDDGAERRMGELFVRVVLSTGLSERRAAAGADGWGEDARIGFVNATGARGYAWVLRFDDAANATEFEDALDGSLSARNLTRDGGVWSGDGRAFRPVRVDDRTVVVFAGAPAFVRAADAGTDGKEIVVAAPGAGERDDGSAGG